MPYEPPSELAAMSLADLAEAAMARKLPPVETWHPAEQGESHMQITADGQWFHEGGLITRPAMVRAFSSLLMRGEDGQHWLVTPQQKLRIKVDDAAFIATDVQQKDGVLAFRLNTDEIVLAGPQHPLRTTGEKERPALYVAVRHGCEARLNRSTYLQLITIALERADAELADTDGGLSVISQNTIFPLVPE